MHLVWVLRNPNRSRREGEKSVFFIWSRNLYGFSSVNKQQVVQEIKAVVIF